MQWEASRVELYQCDFCGRMTRFPRYNHPGKLLDTRKGRCGEWANAFALCCVSMGWETRYCVDFTDHVWCEVFDPSGGGRGGGGCWVHCDPCENAYDAPLMYESGWGKKLTYVFGVTHEEITDVTRRYTRKWTREVLPRRTEAPSEEWLRLTLTILNSLRQASLPPERVQQLRVRATIEEAELNALSQEEDESGEKKENKRMLKPEETIGRISGSQEWKEARGETGAKQSQSCSVPPFIPSFGFDVASSSSAAASSSIPSDSNSTSNTSLNPREGGDDESKFSNHLYFDGITTSSSSSSLSWLCFVKDCHLVTIPSPLGSNEQQVIRLTAQKPSQTGAVWIRDRIPIRDGFLAKFRFRVSKQGQQQQQQQQQGADGFAFVIHNDPRTRGREGRGPNEIIGEGGCELGYGGISHCLAIEFDLYQNEDKCRDPNGNHISIQTRGSAPNRFD